MNSSDKRRLRVAENTPDMVRIGQWFGRRPTTLWSVYEAEALEQLGTLPEDDVDLLEGYYTAADIPEGADCRRRSVETLLNNWNGELDRARRFQARHKPKGSTI